MYESQAQGDVIAWQELLFYFSLLPATLLHLFVHPSGVWITIGNV